MTKFLLSVGIWLHAMNCFHCFANVADSEAHIKLLWSYRSFQNIETITHGFVETH